MKKVRLIVSGRVQGVGERPLFRRLPADRGDGRARPRDAALLAKRKRRR
mgnify:CR=1 FL=1